jgi:pimeloyl-ACP methyl ester carboxylesterase
MSWTAPPRFDLPVCLLHGAADQHTLTGLVEEYHKEVEAPAKNLVLLPGGGHCAVLMQPAAFLAELRACINGMSAGTSGPGSR